jgi:hypothetical protein
MAARINRKQLNKEIFANKNVQKLITNIVEQEVIKEKNIFIKKFNNHPVTKEIEGGPLAKNISSTLGGYGNLFSFIGFTDNNPTLGVKSLLKNIKIGSVIRKQDSYKFKILIPSISEIKKVTKMPWENGRSWLFDIEKYISGLSAYLYGKFKSSRTGTGIQATDFRNAVFKSVPYFTALYDDFIKNINNLKIK